MNRRIADVQKHLKEEKLSGWLLFDFQGRNSLARSFLQIDPVALISRRFFYWIPAQGEPVQIVHQIEAHVLSHLPGSTRLYLSSEDLGHQLRQTLVGASKIAMEYSPYGSIPSLSRVDGGTIEWIRSFGVDVVSSGNFLQYYTCVLSAYQLETHRYAAACLESAVQITWKSLSDALKERKRVTEYDVRCMIERVFAQWGCKAETPPICAVNHHSASPHFEIEKHALPIERGDFVLIDLWCKKDVPDSIYADITRVATASEKPTTLQQEIFTVVKKAQTQAFDYVKKHVAASQPVRGCDVDQAARHVIQEAGYGSYFTHRTGHNIYTEDHGPGAHLDSFETYDERELIPGTCFSIEPGIYLPGKLGVRLEYDVYLSPHAPPEIIGGEQHAIMCLL